MQIYKSGDEDDNNDVWDGNDEEEISTKTRIWADDFHFHNYHHLVVIVINDRYIPNGNYVLIMDLMVKMMKRGDAC